MKAPSVLACPKCGGTMHGPKFVRNVFGDALEYLCGCGFKTHRPTLDAPHPPLPEGSIAKDSAGNDARIASER